MTEKAQVFGAATQTKINVKFLKGGSLTAFKNWSANNAGVQAIFFDTRDKRIYVGNGAGEPECLDSQLNISHSMDANGVTSTILSFTQKETGETMSIPDAIAGTLSDDGKEVNLSTGKSGLMSQIDKLTLDGLAHSLGASIVYEWRAKIEGKDYVLQTTDGESFTYVPEGATEATNVPEGTTPTPYAKFKLTSADMAKNMFFDGGDAPDDLKTLTPHGNLDASTSIKQLEGMTYSELFKQILFETAEPKKVTNPSASISFSSVYNTTVDVGRTFPTIEHLSSSFTSEGWNWVSKNDSSKKGTEVQLSTKGTTSYYYTATNTTSGGTDMSTADYVATEHKVVEGENGYFYGVVGFNKKANATDSLGSETKKDGTYYQEAKEGTATTSTIKFTGAWKMYHNANKIGSAGDIWKVKNLNPGAYVGADVKTAGDFVTAGTTYYMQWCGGTLANQPCYIYIPNSYKISSILMANGTIENKFDIACEYEENPTLVTFSNTYQEGTFKRYEIGKNGSAILSLEIKVVKA